MHIQPPKKKSKHKHRHHRPQDPLPPGNMKLQNMISFYCLLRVAFAFWYFIHMLNRILLAETPSDSDPKKKKKKRDDDPDRKKKKKDKKKKKVSLLK